MKILFYLAAGLLFITGILHLVVVIAGMIDMNAILRVILTVVFGIAYLVIGIRLLRMDEKAILAGVIVPLIGLVLSLIGLASGPNPLAVVFIIIDALVVAACAYLFFAGRTIGRVR